MRARVVNMAPFAMIEDFEVRDMGFRPLLLLLFCKVINPLSSYDFNGNTVRETND